MNYYLTTYNDNSLDISTSFKEYLRQISKFPMLTVEEETSYLEKYHSTGDKDSAHKLVTSHLKLVVKIACYYKYKNSALSIMDLISEGTIGLIDAIKKFDFSKKCRLATYAIYHIKSKIYDFVMNSFSIVKIGTDKVTKKLFGKYKEIAHTNSSESIKEFAEELGTNTDKILATKNRLESRDWSLNTKAYDDNESAEFIDDLSCQRKTQEESIIEYDTKCKYLLAIKKACEVTLDTQEKEIIYYRILSDKTLTLREVGELYGITPEAIRQKQENALKKIRSFINKTTLLADTVSNKSLEFC
jgi:RNA polymerase sigma-32 factor